MKALILNSGLGSRMGDITSTHPKCMTEISEDETIVSRQLDILNENGINSVVMTTGYYNEVLQEYCDSLGLGIKITYVNNPKFRDTNYIYSIYCARKELHDDIIMMHGDLVFSSKVLKGIINEKNSTMVVSSTLPLPEKDFKSVITNGVIEKIGINYFDNAQAAQPLYKLNKKDWEIWLDNIISFCENNNVNCYAENAFNEVSDRCRIYPYDVKDELCSEIDNVEDLEVIKMKVKEYKLGGYR